MAINCSRNKNIFPTQRKTNFLPSGEKWKKIGRPLEALQSPKANIGTTLKRTMVQPLENAWKYDASAVEAI